MTPFSAIYEKFLSRITSDMYLELDQAQTEALLKELLLAALPWFEFPRVNLFAHDGEAFAAELTDEEMYIISTYMIVEWIGQQLATIDLVRMKYSGVSKVCPLNQ